MSRADRLVLDEQDLSALTHVLRRAHEFMDRLRYPRARPHPIDARDWYAFRGEPSPLRPPKPRVVIVNARDRVPQYPGSWAKRAACKGKTEIMFARSPGVIAHRESRPERLRQQQAIGICMSCDVLGECRAWALTDPEPAVDAVAGGMTPRQRHQWRAEHGL